MSRGPLAEAAAVRMLFAAACFDAVLLAAVVPSVVAELRSHLPFAMPEAALYTSVFLLMLLVYWLIFEVLFGGLTVGRLALGLRLRDKTGRRLSFMKHVSRGLTKVVSLGLSGLRFTRLAYHDKMVGALWLGDISPPPGAPLKSWRLRVVSGAHAGRSLRVSSSSGFRDKGVIRIGRSSTWADLPLENEQRVSQKHCVLMQKGGTVQIIDGGKAGSSNGTFLNRTRLTPGVWTTVGSTRRLVVADVVIELERP